MQLWNLTEHSRSMEAKFVCWLAAERGSTPLVQLLSFCFFLLPRFFSFSSTACQIPYFLFQICKPLINLETGLCLIYKEMGKQGDKTQKFCFKSSEEGPHVPDNMNRFPAQCPLQRLRNHLLCRCLTINPGYLCPQCWHQWHNCPPGSITDIGSSIGGLGSKYHHFSLFTYTSDIN